MDILAPRHIAGALRGGAEETHCGFTNEINWDPYLRPTKERGDLGLGLELRAGYGHFQTNFGSEFGPAFPTFWRKFRCQLQHPSTTSGCRESFTMDFCETQNCTPEYHCSPPPAQPTVNGGSKMSDVRNNNVRVRGRVRVKMRIEFGLR